MYTSVNSILPWPRDIVRICFLGVCGYLNLYPFLMILLHVAGLQVLAKSAREGGRFWDFLFGYPFWIGLIIVVELLPWLLALDFIRLPFYPFFEKFKPAWLRIQYQAILSLFIIISIYAFVKTFLDTNRIRVTQRTLIVADLPPGMAGLRIVHLSDIQADARTRKGKLKRLVRKVNKLDPDLIFFSGDLVTSGTKHIDIAAATLGQMESRYGTYACIGDHDIWSSEQQIVEALAENNVKYFSDQNELIHVGGDSIFATFVTSTYSKRTTHNKLYFLMGQQPRGGIDLVVTHQPSDFLVEVAAERGYHLFLGGHTHGGQVVFNLMGFSLTAARFETSYYRGFHWVEKMLVSINNGIGFTFAPIRFRAPAEITLIKVVARKPL
jgi:predicted MPP superfamily phosphohydrolase